MKRLVLLAVVLGGFCLLAAPAVAAKKDGKGKKTTLVVDVLVEESRTSFVDVNGNGEPDAGDAFVGAVDVFRKGTRRVIGTAAFSNLVVSTEGDGSALFSAALRLNGGDIFLEGLTTFQDEPVVFDAIVGGTKKYKGARGQAREKVIGEGDDTSAPSTEIRVRLTFTTDAKKKKGTRKKGG